MDPCSEVRRSCASVLSRAAHVRLDPSALPVLVAALRSARGVAPPAWDEGGWHYSADAPSGGPATAQYVLVLDALNWCFWPSATGLEYEHLARGLTRVLTADAHAFDAPRLEALTPETLASWVAPHELPCLGERVRLLRELGCALREGYGGQAAALVQAARGSAVALVRLLAAALPGFRDGAVHGGEQVALLKRAQIAAADVWAAYGRRTDVGASPFAFGDVARLTCFPDYRLPQLLRAHGVLVYDARTAAAVDAREELPAGGAEEVEIRAATVVAVQALRDVLNAEGGAEEPLMDVEVDWLLWQVGEAQRDTLPPHHRTRTVFY